MPQPTDVYDRAQARVGSVLNGKWTLNALIGVGGMACVYAATHRNKCRFAIKLLHSELAARPTIRRRFLREGYVANTIDHPGTVQVYDDDLTASGEALLVMELLEGETLETRRVRLAGRLPTKEVLVLTAQVLEVLEIAHAKKIVHRDIKPDNLFLTNSGRLKVLDFGIARLHETADQPITRGTKSGTLLGTPGFMAPEQIRGRHDQVDARSDLWAIGATMFTLLSGKEVHEGVTIQEQLINSATQPSRSLRELLPDLPEELVCVVDKALELEPELRYQSAGEMLDALQEVYQTFYPEGASGVSLSVIPHAVEGEPKEALSTAKTQAFSLRSPKVESPAFVEERTTSRALSLTVNRPSSPTGTPGIVISRGVAIAAMVGLVLGMVGVFGVRSWLRSNTTPSSQGRVVAHQDRSVSVSTSASGTVPRVEMVFSSRHPDPDERLKPTDDSEMPSKPSDPSTKPLEGSGENGTKSAVKSSGSKSNTPTKTVASSKTSEKSVPASTAKVNATSTTDSVPVTKPTADPFDLRH
jgi:eukaryotic-like serine/threonine-protein kinase